MIQQGVTYCRTMVDADSTVGLLPIKAANEVKKRYADRIRFEVGVQPLQGVLDPASFEQYAEACELADYCGGLPSRDRPKPEKHLDVILQLAKKLGKPVDVHIDQENNPLENETELLAEKTIEHGMQGRVFGVHAISPRPKRTASRTASSRRSGSRTASTLSTAFGITLTWRLPGTLRLAEDVETQTLFGAVKSAIRPMRQAIALRLGDLLPLLVEEQLVDHHFGHAPAKRTDNAGRTGVTLSVRSLPPHLVVDAERVPSASPSRPSTAAWPCR